MRHPDKFKQREGRVEFRAKYVKGLLALFLFRFVVKSVREPIPDDCCSYSQITATSLRCALLSFAGASMMSGSNRFELRTSRRREADCKQPRKYCSLVPVSANSLC